MGGIAFSWPPSLVVCWTWSAELLFMPDVNLSVFNSTTYVSWKPFWNKSDTCRCKWQENITAISANTSFLPDLFRFRLNVLMRVNNIQSMLFHLTLSSVDESMRWTDVMPGDDQTEANHTSANVVFQTARWEERGHVAHIQYPTQAQQTDSYPANPTCSHPTFWQQIPKLLVRAG